MSDKPSYEELHQKVIDLEKSLGIFRPLVEKSSDLFYRTSLDGKISYISPSVYKLTGYTVEEAIGINLAEEIYLIPDERKFLLEELQSKGEVVNFDAQLKKKMGQSGGHLQVRISTEIKTEKYWVLRE
ncbi:PAS domain-containing protein [uncultured Desulfosarcina sp.]|uniref:PAS domain-containing protein n=1 Tax=uncultured Desulfosarcina sp. TaxID=218289 RepID=UPI0029C79FEA|nr:PAS domain-containing protein [uncultured Desulfosarcina sp.]